MKNRLNNKVIKAGIGYTVGNYLLKGINFLTVPIFTRLMTTQDFGVYSIYMTYDAIVTVFIGFALHSSLKNAKYKYKEEFENYLSSILILPIVFLLLLLVVANLFSVYLTHILDINRVLLNILLCHSFANSTVTIYNNNLGIQYKYKEYLKISTINTLVNLLLSVALMYTIFTNERYLGRIVGSALPLLGISVVIYYLSFSKAKPKVNLDFWKFGLAYSLPIIPHGLSQIILSSFDRVMINGIIGAAEAGIYSLGTNVEQLVKITTTSLDTVWGPWFYERMKAEEYEKIRRTSTYYAYGMFILISCLMLAGPEIIWIMGSVEYQDAKYVVIPLLNCTFFTFLYTLPAQVEYYYKKTYMIALGTMGAAVINVILNYFFIRWYGYRAAAYTTLVAYIMYFVFHYLMAKRIAGRQLFDTKIIILLIIGVLLVNYAGLVLVNHFWLRLLIGVIDLVVNGLFLFSMVKKDKKIVKA